MKEGQQTKHLRERNLLATWNLFSGRFLVFCLWIFVLFACNTRKDLIDAPLYTGPLSSMDSSVNLISDSGVVVMEMRAPRQDNFESGDREWSKGCEMKWFDKEGKITSYFSANYVYFTKADNLYRAEGNVVVKSYEKNDELNTEELFWDQSGAKFYTEKFVTIKSDDEVHTGEGMEANQNFTEYRILKPNGTFTLEDDPNTPANRDIPLTPSSQN